MSLFRIVESITTAICYLALGLFSAESIHASGIMLPGVLLGLLLGRQLLSSLRSDTFRSICMATDALLVGFGLSRLVVGLGWVAPAVANGALAALVLLELALVVRFLRNRPAAGSGSGGTSDSGKGWGSWEASGRAVVGHELDYPVALKLSGRSVLLVGAGRVAELRLAALLDAGANVHVVAPAATAGIRELAVHGKIRLTQRAYQPGDCEGAELIFAATGELDVSRIVAAEARRRGRLVNSADLPELCDFNLPSVGRRGPVTVAVSTSGLAPGLARVVRERAMEHIGPEYGVVARLLGRLRKLLPRGPARSRLFGELLASDLVDRVREGKRSLARERVRKLVEASGTVPGVADSREAAP
jgi:precorrin-2 dehydrogenase/sirohydrochlorin ferrochelatase